MRVTMLGCGSSSGVPMIGCTCVICQSTNPKNKRSRVSVFIEINGKHLLIDTSPDLRQQALSNRISRIDAILYTHAHADHTHGIDDIRSFNYLSGNALPAYGNVPTMDMLKRCFPYIFQPPPEYIWFRPSITPHAFAEQPVHRFTAAETEVTAFEQNHGKNKSTGYRIGNFAYSTDTDGLPDSSLAELDGLDLWIVDCLRYKESLSHSHLARTLGWIEQLKPKRAVLTHMGHEFDYDTLSKELPAGVVPGYDGMVIDIQEKYA